MTFDDLIAQGIRDTLGEKCAENLTGGKNHRFSIAYRIRRASIIRSRRSRPRFTIRKIKYILIAVIIALFTLTGFSVWRKFGGFSFNVFKDHSRVYFSGEVFKTEIEEIYGLPEEYEILSISLSKYDAYSKYMINGEIVTLSQDLSSAVGNANTENYEAEYLTINGNDGYYINMHENGNGLTWVMNGYRFYLFGEIDKSTVVFLAESLKIKNFDKIP